jgi:hypothetical protein
MKRSTLIMIHAFMRRHGHLENLAVCKHKRGNEHTLQCTMRSTSYLDSKMAPLRQQEDALWLNIMHMDTLKLFSLGFGQRE